MEYDKELLKTLIYFNIFDYPLTFEEISQFFGKKITKEKLKTVISKTPQVKTSKKFYYLNSKESLVVKRQFREKISKEKFLKAKKIIKILSRFPTVLFIGISGALSMKNSDENDDIDLFVITEDELVWFSRFFLVLLLMFLGVYRNKNESKYKDKICLNLLLGRNRMKFTGEDKNIYVAHEIAQLIPIFDKKDTYEYFISENKWIFNYFPNIKNRLDSNKTVFIKQNTFFINKTIELLRALHVELLFRTLQFLYMKRNITNEKIEENFLAFHPFDYKKDTLQKLNLEISKYF